MISFTIGTDGRATECRLESGLDPTKFITFDMPCDYGKAFPVYIDAAGKPVARTVRMTIGVTLPGSTPAPRKKRRR